jgi:hypothetical protein
VDRAILIVQERQEIMSSQFGAWKSIVLPDRSNGEELPLVSEIHRHLSIPLIIFIPVLFSYALYYVITFMRDIIYLAIT